MCNCELHGRYMTKLGAKFTETSLNGLAMVIIITDITL